MSSYKDLLQQREELEKKIQDARKIELTEAVRKARELVEEYGLNTTDIFPVQRAGKGTKGVKGVKVAPKYRNPTTGETWTGRGKAPKWIQDQDRTKFAI